MALDTTGNPAVIAAAVESLATHGTASVITSSGAPVTVPPGSLLLKGRSLRGSMGGHINPTVFIPRLLELHAQRPVPGRPAGQELSLRRGQHRDRRLPVGRYDQAGAHVRLTAPTGNTTDPDLVDTSGKVALPLPASEVTRGQARIACHHRLDPAGPDRAVRRRVDHRARPRARRLRRRGDRPGRAQPADVRRAEPPAAEASTSTSTPRTGRRWSDGVGRVHLRDARVQLLRSTRRPRTRSTTCSTSGRTRRPASSATAASRPAPGPPRCSSRSSPR